MKMLKRGEHHNVSLERDIAKYIETQTDRIATQFWVFIENFVIANGTKDPLNTFDTILRFK